MTSKPKILTAAIAAALAFPGLVSASDLTMFKTVFNTDFTAAGEGGMRGDGTGEIDLSGVSGTVTEAYLFWHGPSNATNNNANANVNFNGTDVTGSFLGISSDNCWGFANSLAYRANVSSLVSGNGLYTLSNFVKRDADINGASLIVFFNDGNTANNRDVVMFQGNDSNIPNSFDADGWNIALNGINYSSGDANIQLHVSDGQVFGDDEVTVNGTGITGLSDRFPGDSDAEVNQNNDGNNLNGYLWDIESYSITSLLNPGANNLALTSGVAGDCLSCILIAIDLPAGAAPPPPPPPGVPEPATLSLLGLGLLGLRGLRRNKAAA